MSTEDAIGKGIDAATDAVNEVLNELGPPPAEAPCGARTIFWPDVEACEAECILPAGHQPSDVHEDDVLGEWSENELPTWRADE